MFQLNTESKSWEKCEKAVTIFYEKTWSKKFFVYFSDIRKTSDIIIFRIIGTYQLYIKLFF